MNPLSVDEIDLTDIEFWRRSDMDTSFATLRRERPVSWQTFDPSGPEGTMKGFWALSRYDDIVRVSSDSKTFINGQSSILQDQTVAEAREEGWFLNMDGTEHFKLRQIVAKAFSPQSVQVMKEVAVRYAHDLVAAVKEHGECDFAKDIAQPFPVQVICDYLGLPTENRKRLHELTMIALGGDAPELGSGEGVVAAFKELNDYGRTVSAERRRNPGNDVLSVIQGAEVDGHKLNDQDVGYFLQLLLTAGMETTGTVGGQGMRAFLQFPEQIQIWKDDPVGIARTGFEELARWVTPVRYMRRTASVDCEVGGQQIASGDKVVMWYGSANRDETKFENADKFDVRRDPNPHLAFGGGGRHTCLGSHFARMELPLLFAEVFKNLGNIELAGEPHLLPARFVNGLASLPIRFKPL
jgi:cytochrome P450